MKTLLIIALGLLLTSGSHGQFNNNYPFDMSQNPIYRLMNYFGSNSQQSGNHGLPGTTTPPGEEAEEAGQGQTHSQGQPSWEPMMPTQLGGHGGWSGEASGQTHGQGGHGANANAEAEEATPQGQGHGGAWSAEGGLQQHGGHGFNQGHASGQGHGNGGHNANAEAEEAAPSHGSGEVGQGHSQGHNAGHGSWQGEGGSQTHGGHSQEASHGFNLGGNSHGSWQEGGHGQNHGQGHNQGHGQTHGSQGGDDEAPATDPPHTGHNQMHVGGNQLHHDTGSMDMKTLPNVPEWVIRQIQLDVYRQMKQTMFEQLLTCVQEKLRDAPTNLPINQNFHIF